MIKLHCGFWDTQVAEVLGDPWPTSRGEGKLTQSPPDNVLVEGLTKLSGCCGRMLNAREGDGNPGCIHVAANLTGFHLGAANKGCAACHKA